jgi:hypothetical protein
LAKADARLRVMNNLLNHLQDQLAAVRAERDALRAAITNPEWVAMGHESAKIYLSRPLWNRLMGIPEPAPVERCVEPV